MFIDKVRVQFLAGKGGNGVIAWTREKYIPKGGPAGGDGGKGSSIILIADENVPSLEWFQNRSKIVADKGRNGGGACRTGRNGRDLILKVPCGTLVRDSQTQEIYQDLCEHGQEYVICKGGTGGLGNFHFRTPTNQAPNISTPGEEGEVKSVELELKLIADVGLVGFPNVGKSTLLSSITKARPKIGDYHFTTLRPNLGFLSDKEKNKILIADIPGIIDGASQNRGLGLEFLRHIERTKALLIVLDASCIEGPSLNDVYTVLQNEFKSYGLDLQTKPYLIVLNKCDVEDATAHIEEFKKTYPELQEKMYCISALEHQGLQELVEAIYEFFN